MDQGYACNHAWLLDHADWTGEEQDRYGRRIARLTSTYWICHTCGATNVTIKREEVGDIAYSRSHPSSYGPSARSV